MDKLGTFSGAYWPPRIQSFGDNGSMDKLGTFSGAYWPPRIQSEMNQNQEVSH